MAAQRATQAGLAGAGEIPDSVAAAWGVRERPHKGPKPGLSLARIVGAAVRVADTEGLDAVAMGRVAAELGAAPMSLYRHVSSKEELLRLMVDAAWGDPPGRRPPGETWRDGLSRWAWAMRAAISRHLWVVRIPISGLPIMPREIAWFEDALACLAGTGLTEARKASVVMLLSGYVRNLATTEADIEAAIRASGLPRTSGWRRTRACSRSSPTRGGTPRSPRSSRPACSTPPTNQRTSSSSAWTASWTASGRWSAG